MANQQTKIDPIREQYYSPAEKTEKLLDGIFVVTAVLSILTLLIKRESNEALYDTVQSAFVIFVLSMFFIGQYARLHLNSRAEDKRRQDFFAKAYDLPLTHEETTGYYNNNQTKPHIRIAAQTLENSLFSKTIANEMVKYERIKSGLFLIVWLIAVLTRWTDLAVVTAAAQIVFGEQIIARWWRMEWLRVRFEKTYEDLYRLIIQSPDRETKEFKAMTQDLFSSYETTKAYGGILMSSKIFNKINQKLSQQWIEIKNKINI